MSGHGTSSDSEGDGSLPILRDREKHAKNDARKRICHNVIDFLCGEVTFAKVIGGWEKNPDYLGVTGFSSGFNLGEIVS